MTVEGRLSTYVSGIFDIRHDTTTDDEIGTIVFRSTGFKKMKYLFYKQIHKHFSLF